MTVRDIKELVANYPDNMPVCFLTFRGVESDGWLPPDDLEIEDVSVEVKNCIKKEDGTYKVLNILLG